MAEDYAEPPIDLDPDELVEGLQQGDRTPQDLSTLSGFLGESDARGYHRLFMDATLTCWVDIPDKDIRYRRRIAGEQDGFGARSVVWVTNGAKLVRGELTIAGAEADFLTGPWSADIPWRPGDDGIDGATHAPKFAPGMGSPQPTPYGRGCC